MDLRKYCWAFRALCWKAMGRRIGFPTYIGPPVYVGGIANIIIGKRVRIWPNLRIEAINNARIYIENDVIIGQGCHITAGTDLHIRSGTVLIGNNVVTNIHHPSTPLDQHPADREISIEPVELGERLLIGFGAVILPGSQLASGSTVGANAVVSRLQVKQASIIAGVPARILRHI